MTKEEAIKILKEIIDTGWLISDIDKCTAIDACEMAIEALEQEPCEDAISRKAVLDQTYLWSKDEFLRVTNPFDYLRKRINSLLPVTPQPGIGRWIIIDDCELFMAKCSKCGEIVDSRMISKYPYCHCGAKMVEPQERSDI